jgi:hypothetical protein
MIIVSCSELIGIEGHSQVDDSVFAHQWQRQHAVLGDSVWKTSHVNGEEAEIFEVFCWRHT